MIITNIIKKCKERIHSYTLPRTHLNTRYLSFAMQTTVRQRMYGMSAYLHTCTFVFIRNVQITSRINDGILHITGQSFQRHKEAFPIIHWKKVSSVSKTALVFFLQNAYPNFFCLRSFMLKFFNESLFELFSQESQWNVLVVRYLCTNHNLQA